jgi:hypothetical protein
MLVFLDSLMCPSLEHFMDFLATRRLFLLDVARRHFVVGMDYSARAMGCQRHDFDQIMPSQRHHIR